MSILAFTNQKGGVGKTSSTIGLAMTLVREPYCKRTLLVDLDPQGHASLLSGGMRDQSRRPPIYRVLVEEEPIRTQIKPTEYGFDLLAGGLGNAATEKQLGDMDDGPELLARALATVKDDYDVVLLDCPPNLGQLLICALGAAEFVVVPTQLDALPLDGLEQLLAKIRKSQSTINPRLQLGAILVNHVSRNDERTNLAQHIRSQLTEQCGDIVLNTIVHTSIKIKEATENHLPVIAYAPGATSSAEYSALAAEMIERRLL